MFRVKVTDKQKSTWGMDFPNVTQANQWIEGLKVSGVYGQPERWQLDSAEAPLSAEAKATALETRTTENGIEYKLPAEYTIEITDVAAEYAAAAAKLAAAEAAQKRIDALDVPARLATATTVPTLRAAIQDILADLVALRKRP